jgi:hypothetical protein
LAVGQAFDLAYKRYKANQTGPGKDGNQMKQRVESAEKENEALRKKLEEMEKMNQKQDENTPPPLASVAAAPVSQVCSRFSFSVYCTVFLLVNISLIYNMLLHAFLLLVKLCSWSGFLLPPSLLLLLEYTGCLKKNTMEIQQAVMHHKPGMGLLGGAGEGGGGGGGGGGYLALARGVLFFMIKQKMIRDKMRFSNLSNNMMISEL